MSLYDSDLASGPNSTLQSITESDSKAIYDKEIVDNLELRKKHLLLETQHLEEEIASKNAESFSRDQLSTVKSELEHNCNVQFQKRTNSLLIKLEQAKAERSNLEKQVKSLQKSLANEQRLTKQLAEERDAQRPPKPLALPEVSLPDINILRDTYVTAYRKRAIEEEIREAERQLAQRKQSIAEGEAKLLRIIQDSKTASAQYEAQIRSETLELAQLEETKASLKERLESARIKQKQLEIEKRSLQSQIESAELNHRAKIDEINRQFLEAQREFDESRAKKKAEIRELTRRLKENEELNKSKLHEKELLLQELKEIQDKQARDSISKSVDGSHNALKRSQSGSYESSPSVQQLKIEINHLEEQKAELYKKRDDLIRKMTSNEKKLQEVKDKVKKKIKENEMQKTRQIPDPRNKNSENESEN